MLFPAGYVVSVGDGDDLTAIAGGEFGLIGIGQLGGHYLVVFAYKMNLGDGGCFGDEGDGVEHACQGGAYAVVLGEGFCVGITGEGADADDIIAAGSEQQGNGRATGIAHQFQFMPFPMVERLMHGGDIFFTVLLRCPDGYGAVGAGDILAGAGEVAHVGGCVGTCHQ